MLHEKADVIQECIEIALKEKLIHFTNSIGRNVAWRIIETLEQFKTDVDALALQEAESHANDVLWTMEPSDTEMIEIGVKWASITISTAELQRDDYRRP